MSEPECPCCYCRQEAHNVIEVRFARTLKSASAASKRAMDDERAPREIVGRGYFVCDGCLALLDYHEEHHIDPARLAFFNVLSGAYQLFLIWGLVAVWALAQGNFDRLAEPRFHGMGLVLALVALVVWLLRASVLIRYVNQWRAHRGKPIRPRNSLGAFTDLRDKVSPELAAYLPVRYEDSIPLAALPGSLPTRSIGPRAEPWGAGPGTNFAGRGDNDWYRLIWISWRLWPLSRVQVPAGVEWTPPPLPPVQEVEVSLAAFLGMGSMTFLVLVLRMHPIGAVTVGLALGAIGYVVGRVGRQRWAERQLEKYSDAAV